MFTLVAELCYECERPLGFYLDFGDHKQADNTKLICHWCARGYLDTVKFLGFPIEKEFQFYFDNQTFGRHKEGIKWALNIQHSINYFKSLLVT